LLKKTSQLLFSKIVHGKLKSTNRLNSGTIVRLFGPMMGLKKNKRLTSTLKKCKEMKEW
jgi:hypothetical protein